MSLKKVSPFFACLDNPKVSEKPKIELGWPNRNLLCVINSEEQSASIPYVSYCKCENTIQKSEVREDMRSRVVNMSLLNYCSVIGCEQNKHVWLPNHGCMSSIHFSSF